MLPRSSVSRGNSGKGNTEIKRVEVKISDYSDNQITYTFPMFIKVSKYAIFIMHHTRVFSSKGQTVSSSAMNGGNGRLVFCASKVS